MKWEKLREMNHYVLVGKNCTKEIKEFWGWLLEIIPDIEITNRDGGDNIEFIASKETAKYLLQLHWIDYGDIFEGTLEEFYEF